jgi:hypothetical protein
MANFYVSVLAPNLRLHGLSYLAHHITTLALSGDLSLDKTASLLHSVIASKEALQVLQDEVAEAMASLPTGTVTSGPTTSVASLTSTSTSTTTTSSHSSSTTGEFRVNLIGKDDPAYPSLSLSTRAVIVKAFLSLLQLPVRLDSQQSESYILPEVLQWDGKRLAKIRDTLDVITVQCAVNIVVKQTLAKLGVLQVQEEKETEFFHRLNVLLRDPEIGISSVMVEAARYVKARLAEVGGLQRPAVRPAGGLVSYCLFIKRKYTLAIAGI